MFESNYIIQEKEKNIYMEDFSEKKESKTPKKRTERTQRLEALLAKKKRK